MNVAVDLRRLPAGWDEARLRRLADTIRATDRASTVSDGRMSEADALAEAYRRVTADSAPDLPDGWTEAQIDQLGREEYDRRSESPRPLTDRQWAAAKITQPSALRLIRSDIIDQINNGLIEPCPTLDQTATLAAAQARVLGGVGRRSGARSLTVEQVLPVVGPRRRQNRR